MRRMSSQPVDTDAGAARPQRVLRGSLGILGAFGAALFTALFAASFVDPLFVEGLAKEVIRIEVQKRVEERIEAIDQKYLMEKGKRLIEIENAKIAAFKEQARQGVPKRVSAVLEQMRDASCKCRQLADLGESYFKFDGRIAQAREVIAHLDGLIRAKYMETAAQLTREFRIFTGSNALVFALLALAVFVKKKAGVHLVPAAGLLLVGAAVTAGFYLFNQDWLHTIVFSQYVGLAYLGYLAVALVLFADIVFNRARGTALALNVMGSVVGAAVSVLPC